MALLGGNFSLSDLQNAFQGSFSSNVVNGVNEIEYQDIKITIGEEANLVRFYKRNFNGGWDLLVQLQGTNQNG